MLNKLNNANLNDVNMIKEIINMLSNDINEQKNFINILKHLINQVFSQNKEALLIIQKINNILPFLISELSIPFCDLIYNNDIISFYVKNYLINKTDIIKSILIKFINVFNYESIDNTPADEIIGLLEKVDNDIKKMVNEKRNKRTEIEDIYYNLNSICNKINNKKDDDIQEYQKIIKEGTEILNDFEEKNTYSKATIQFLREKIKIIENYINKENKINILPNLNKINLNNNFNEINNNLNNFFPFFNQFNYLNNFNLINNNHPSKTNTKIQEEIKQLKEIPLNERTFFYRDEELKEGEDEYIEFKYYNYPFSQDKIDELKRQYCGFLNSQGGRIYIGINDLRVVKGIYLDYKTRDIIRNELINYTYDFYPKCRINKINVYFIPVKSIQNKKFIPNLYVIQIIILPGEPFNLYSLTNKGGFISALRLPGQCINLTAEEIYEEIMKRGELLRVKYAQQYNEKENESEKNDNETQGDSTQDNNDEEINEESVESDGTKGNKTKIIFIAKISNIDTSLKIKDINKFFNGCNCSYQKFPSENGKSKGYGEIHFSKKEIAKSFIKKYNKIHLCGRKEINMKLTKRRALN